MDDAQRDTQPPAETLANEREAIIAAITKADADFGYSYRLTKLDDTGEEHTLLMDGFEPAVFEDHLDGYPVIEQRRNAARTDAILAALTPKASAGGDAGAVERLAAEVARHAQHVQRRPYYRDSGDMDASPHILAGHALELIAALALPAPVVEGDAE